MLRIDVASKPVGTFFGGREQSSHSELCPVCSKPGLVTKAIRRGLTTTRYYAHAFELRLNRKNEPECIWDDPCVDKEKAPE